MGLENILHSMTGKLEGSTKACSCSALSSEWAHAGKFCKAGKQGFFFQELSQITSKMNNQEVYESRPSKLLDHKPPNNQNPGSLVRCCLPSVQ